MRLVGLAVILATSFALGPIALVAQPSDKIFRIGVLERTPAATMYASTEFGGGLASYGVNYPDHYRRAATFADKIFKGAKPADLPVEQPPSSSWSSISRPRGRWD